MKILLFALIVISSTVAAQDVDVLVDDSSTMISSDNEVYKSSTGNRYEYDLSDPGDRVEYEVDPGAQLRDEISVDPTREIDQGLGEQGGGIYD